MAKDFDLLPYPQYSSPADSDSAGKIAFSVNPNGNLLLTDFDGSIVFNSNTHGSGRIDLIMQPDGNLVAYANRGSDGNGGNPIWSSGSVNKGVGPYCTFLAMDRSFTVYDANCKPVASLNTGITDRPSNPDGTCKTYIVIKDDFCSKIAGDFGITVDMFQRYNNINCNDVSALFPGQKVCVTLGTIPLPPPNQDGTCQTREVGVDGDFCYELADSCGIDLGTFEKLNNGIDCNMLFAYQRVCCSLGNKPLRTPSPVNGNCFWQTANDTYYNCGTFAARWDVKVNDIENWNSAGWRWGGCDDLQAEQKVCLSAGTPPLPDFNPDVECGGEHNNDECPLKACCSKWGYCGTTAEYCEVVPGGPGNGCQSNCGTGIPPERLKCEGVLSKSIGYWQSWSTNLANGCPISIPDLESLASRWTHIHYAFASIDSNFQLVIDDYDALAQFTAVKKTNPGVKLIMSVGGWNFNDPGDTRTRFSDLANSQSNRATFVGNVVNFLRTYGLDGFDIDWEYPSADDRGGRPSDSQAYVALVSDLRAAFGPWYSLSIAAPASNWYLRGFAIDQMAPFCECDASFSKL
ncbi:hypothetical protein HDU76_000471 [Blyttiomyces sp. JEL0837]|nr:hypothetical protein HDU76_000471 [Blyttiomyces sp. JEL0837]